MVQMRELKLYVDEDVLKWLENNRADAGLEEFASLLLGEHVRSCTRNVLLHDDMIKKLDDLEGRIKRLNNSLNACAGKR
jgi:hypothetical protein